MGKLSWSLDAKAIRKGHARVDDRRRAARPSILSHFMPTPVPAPVSVPGIAAAEEFELSPEALEAGVAAGRSATAVVVERDASVSRLLRRWPPARGRALVVSVSAVAALCLFW